MFGYVVTQFSHHAPPNLRTALLIAGYLMDGLDTLYEFEWVVHISSGDGGNGKSLIHFHFGQTFTQKYKRAPGEAFPTKGNKKGDELWNGQIKSQIW